MFASCEDKQQGTIDLSDITGESERYKEGDEPEELPIEEKDSTLVVKEWFQNQGMQVSSIVYRTERLFPDRFGPLSIEKYVLYTPADTIQYSKWIYEDSSKVMNAFTNWTNCFGNKCKTIFFGEAKNFQKNPMQVLMNDTSLVFIEGNKSIDFKAWNEFHKVDDEDEPWNYVVEQSRWTKARWYEYPKGERTKIEL